jgi:hypothetical protein
LAGGCLYILIVGWMDAWMDGWMVNAGLRDFLAQSKKTKVFLNRGKAQTA